jgi:hypothetical protein
MLHSINNIYANPQHTGVCHSSALTHAGDGEGRAQIGDSSPGAGGTGVGASPVHVWTRSAGLWGSTSDVKILGPCSRLEVAWTDHQSSD